MGAKPHWSQVGRYLPRLRALRGPGYLSWLIPATAKTDADPVEGVQVRTWQDVAFVLDRWNRLVSPENRNSINFRLVEEFVRHLWEERVAVTGGIDRDDAASLGRYELALKRLQGVIRLAAERVHAQRRVAHAGRPKGAPACGFFEHVLHDERWPESAYFEWRGTHDGLRRQPSGSFAFGAGVSWVDSRAWSRVQFHFIRG